MNRFHNINTLVILKSLASFEANTTKQIKKACDELAELNLRKVSHPLMKHSVLCHYKAISLGVLLPDFAFKFCANPIMRHASILTLDDQRNLLSGAKLSVAAFDKIGNIVSVELSVGEIGRSDMEIVFSDTGMRPFIEQEKILRSRTTPKPRLNKNSREFFADVDSGQILFNNFKFKPHELSQVLKLLGFKLVRLP